ncbi:MAG: Lrp/AsnC family leucine-responsive transcriptional regulator [Arenicella sp.]|jgi:Lrp/AsnC family leucine-responsive transcriptional regulator
MLDDTDKKLLDLIQTDASLTNKQLASHLNLSVTPVYERIRKLKKSGVIEAIQAKINRHKIDKGMMIICEVSVDSHTKESLDLFESEVGKLKEVIECFHVSGKHDYMLKVVQSNMDEYRNFLLNKLSKIEGVDNVNSTFVMHELERKNYSLD